MTGNDSHSTDSVLRLDQFLKLNSLVETGGQAKLLIQGGEVKVNGVVETRRGRKLSLGDLIEIDGKSVRVEAGTDE